MAGDMTSDPGWEFLRLSDDEMNEARSRPFDSKKNVWIPDTEEGFIPVDVKSVKGDQVTVVTVRGDEKTLKKDAVQAMNPPKFEKTEDMSNLTILNEASVLHNLRARYGCMMIYTYSGLFCVVINPYKRLPIYTPSVVHMFKGKRRNEMPPHLFAVADQAYRNMNIDRENQSMLITGESGAGKTENTKKVISYLALVGCSTDGEPELGPDGKKKPTLEEQIVQTNPVLEAFGNAKTVRNNNSSRFGKFIRSHFNRDGKLAGGDIEHYLLEKSRAIKQNPGERCYHIFYQICSGRVKDLKEDKCLLDLPIGDYGFVNQGELIIDGVDDQEELSLTEEAFDIMGYSQREKDELYMISASNMHTGNMKFKQRPREEQAEADGMDECEKACKLWGVQPEDYMKAILKPRVKVGTEWVNKGQNLEQVKWSVGAMGKGIYDRTFTWLVKRCNKTLDANLLKREYFIGVLDIAGFEIFDYNSFEQLWINFVNERLQQFFNHHMFVLEQEEYGREGIPWEVIDFGMDLAACIELIEKPLGIISMMDEECIVPKATDLTLAQKLSDQHLGKHPNFQKPKPPKGKQAEAHFALVHYAGTVRYNVTAWLEKNKDPLNDTCVSVMKSSTTNELLLGVWKSYTTQEEAMEAAKTDGGGARKKGKSGAFMTVSMIYREGLNNLMHMLHQTHPHFIRCIIPNELKKAGVLDAALVLNQLTCNGVLEGIRICRKGFPNRLLFPDFKQRYSVLASVESGGPEKEAIASSSDMVAKLIKDGEMTNEEAKIGKMKVFFKAGILAHLEDLRDVAIAKILTSLQGQIRWWLARKEAMIRKDQRDALTLIQGNVRSWCTLRNWPWFKLYAQVRPLLKAGKQAEEMEKLQEQLKATEENLAKEENSRKSAEEANAKLESEKIELRSKLSNSSTSSVEMEEKNQKLNAQKKDMEKQISELSKKLGDQEDRSADINNAKKKVEAEVEAAKRVIQDMELNIRKQESEKQARDHQIKSLQAEMAQQDEGISKVSKEKKHQEEVNRKLTEDLQAEEEKLNHVNKVRAKLENTMDELEENIEREKRSRQDVEKTKRKIEGELKIASENIDELNKIKRDLEGNVHRKEQDISVISSRLEDEQIYSSKLLKQIKKLESRVAELEDELNNERQARSKAEKGRHDLLRELEEIRDRLEEAGGVTAAQIENNKKREAELGKLRRDIEESNLNHEAQLNTMKKKHGDAVAEMGDQLNQMTKQKFKIEKERMTTQREAEELQNGVDSEQKAKQNFERNVKSLEVQNAELQAKSKQFRGVAITTCVAITSVFKQEFDAHKFEEEQCDEQVRQLQDLDSFKKRHVGETSELCSQLEESEAQISALNKLKQQLSSQLAEVRRNLDEETQAKQSTLGQMRNYQHESELLQIQLEEESEAKSEVQRQLSKTNVEIQQWKAKFDSEGIARAEEIEESKRKLLARISELQAEVTAANQRVNTVEKHRNRVQADLEDSQADVERATNYAQSLEKRQAGFDKVMEDWKRKCDDLAAELDASQRDARYLSTQGFNLKNGLDEAAEQIGALQRENGQMVQEVKDLTDQLSDGGRSVHELQKIKRKLELEKDELQTALNEAEVALESEENKVVGAQLEITQIKQAIEKRLLDKEEEFETTRKNHLRALESMQASLEAESKGRQELQRMKKKLESDINEMEIALDHANKANADAQRNMKKYQDQIRELQMQIEDEQRSRDEIREQYCSLEKRCGMLQSDKDEAQAFALEADRIRRSAEIDANDARQVANDLNVNNSALTAAKRKIEGEMQVVHNELEDTVSELKQADERAKVSMMDAARMAEELAQEQEHSLHVERMRKGLELQVKEMADRLDEAEAAALKGGKKTIQMLEAKIQNLEAGLEQEARRHQDTTKNLRKQERVTKEFQFRATEDRKTVERQQELTEQLMNKIKVYKRQIDEAEQLAGSNLHKFRQLQGQMEDAQERADTAENSLSKMRLRTRGSGALMLSQSAIIDTSNISNLVRSSISDL